MIRAFTPSLIVAAFALMVGTTVSPPLHAQDRPDQQRDQPAADREARPSSEQRGPAQEQHEPAQEQRAPAEEHRGAGDEHSAAVEDHRGGPPDDDAVALRRAHPHAAARCHDGFFTNTRNRARACSKHGGIDIWLAI